MQIKSLENHLKSQVKEEIADQELSDLNHKQKSVLYQKFGIWEPVISKDELTYWEMRSAEGDNYGRD